MNLHRRPLAELAALLVVLQLLACALTASAVTVTNFVRSNTFNPASMSINAGDTVVWVWESGVHSTIGNTNFWNSGILSVGQTFTKTFPTAGTYDYFCSVHSFPGGSGHNGTLIVQAVNQPPTVSLTSPTNGTKVLATTNFLLSATATDPGGSVARVDIFSSASAGVIGDPICSLNGPGPTFQFTTNLPGGTFFFTAVATDNQGATNKSAAVQIFSLTNATLVVASPLTSAAVFTVSNSFAGQQYFVDALTNFTGELSTRWFPIATNTAPSNNFLFTDPGLLPPGPRLYRVRQTL